jgi:hypothetical protein
MSSLFDTMIAHPRVAETEKFLVCAVLSADNTEVACHLRTNSLDDWISFGYSLGLTLRSHGPTAQGLSVLDAFVTAAIAGLLSTKDFPPAGSPAASDSDVSS